jgi:hypothetical protein
VTALHAPQRFEHATVVTLLDPKGRHVRVMTPWQRPALPNPLMRHFHI